MFQVIKKIGYYNIILMIIAIIALVLSIISVLNCNKEKMDNTYNDILCYGKSEKECNQDYCCSWEGNTSTCQNAKIPSCNF